MATLLEVPKIRPEDIAALEMTIQNLIQGVRDARAMERAAKEMDEARDQLREQLGELNVAAELTERDE